MTEAVSIKRAQEMYGVPNPSIDMIQAAKNWEIGRKGLNYKKIKAWSDWHKYNPPIREIKIINEEELEKAKDKLDEFPSAIFTKNKRPFVCAAKRKAVLMLKDEFGFDFKTIAVLMKTDLSSAHYMALDDAGRIRHRINQKIRRNKI